MGGLRAEDSEAAERKASDVARRIAADIIHDGWIVGRRLGTEGELMARHGAGRKTVREAMRLLEQQSVVGSVRGPAGGAFVKGDALDAFTNNLRSFIELSGCSLEDVLDAYEPLMRLLIETALTRISPGTKALSEGLGPALRSGAGADRFSQALSLSAPLVEVGAAVDNPGLAALVHMLHHLVADFARQARIPESLWAEIIDQRRLQMAALIEAVVRGDRAAFDVLADMHEATRANLARLEALDGKIWSRRSFLQGDLSSTLSARGGSARALLLSYRIAADIRRAPADPPIRLGTREALAARYDVSERTAAEAIQLLDFFGLVRVRRGRSKGVEAVTPDASAVVAASSLYLRQHAPRPGALADAQAALEAVAGSRLAKRAPHDPLRIALTVGETAGCAPPGEARAAARQAYDALAALAEAPVVGLILGVLVDAGARAAEGEAPTDPAPLTAALARVTGALLDGDGPERAAAATQLLAALAQASRS